MKILFLSNWFPFPPVNGSELRIYNLLQGLGGQHEVTLLSFASETDLAMADWEMAVICVRATTVTRPVFNPHSRKAQLGFLSPKPRSIIDTYSPEMAGHIQQELATTQYNLIIASQLMMAAYAKLFNDTPAMFEELELALMYEQYAQSTSWQSRLRQRLTWGKHRRYLTSILDRFDAVTVVSEEERLLFEQHVANRPTTAIIPNCVDLASYAGATAVPQSAALIYTGSFGYSVNYEAMVWYLSKVHPLVQAVLPEAQVIITGDHKGLPLPATPNLTLTGFVDDVRPYIASATVSLAPILQGGGTRLKILEAMALRVPVVSTSKGAEGLAVVSGHHLLIADTPEEFATAILTLLHDPDTANRLATNAYQLVSEHYDWTVTLPRFLQLVEETSATTNRKPKHKQRY